MVSPSCPPGGSPHRGFACQRPERPRWRTSSSLSAGATSSSSPSPSCVSSPGRLAGSATTVCAAGWPREPKPVRWSWTPPASTTFYGHPGRTPPRRPLRVHPPRCRLLGRLLLNMALRYGGGHPAYDEGWPEWLVALGRLMAPSFDPGQFASPEHLRLALRPLAEELLEFYARDGSYRGRASTTVAGDPHRWPFYAPRYPRIVRRAAEVSLEHGGIPREPRPQQDPTRGRAAGPTSSPGAERVGGGLRLTVRTSELARLVWGCPWRR